MQLQMMLEESIGESHGYAFGEFQYFDVRNDGDLERFVEWLGDEQFVALDFETLAPKSAGINTPAHYDMAEILLASVSHRLGTAVIHCPPARDPALTDAVWRPFLEPLLDRVLIMHNSSYDVSFLHRVCGRLPAGVLDTMALFGVITPGKAIASILKSQSLSAVVQVLFNVAMDKSVRETFVLETFGGVTSEQCRYAAEDARWTFLAAVEMLRICQSADVMHIAELEYRLTPVLLRMQMRGVAVDMQVVREYSERIEQIIGGIERDILSILEQDEWTVIGFINSKHPVRMKRLVQLMREGSEMPIHVLEYPVSILPGQKGMYDRAAGTCERLPRKPAKLAFNLRSPQQVLSYLWCVSNGAISSTESKQLEIYSQLILSGQIESPYPQQYVQLLPELLQLLVDYRAVSKIQSTYLKSWQNLERNGRVHTTFVQTYAESGRISSRHPNLQNCPRPDTTRFLERYIGEPLDMRGMFVAPPGYVLITADYSQYELRVAAERSDQHNMIDVYVQEYEVRQQLERLLYERYGLYPWQESEVESVIESDAELQQLKNRLKDLDFHTQNAARIFRKQPNEVTKQERSEAKSISFGVLYGMRAKSLAAQIRHMTGREISVEDAQKLLDAYFGTYRNLHTYIQKTIHRAQTRGFVASIYGRKRWCVFSRFARDATGLHRLISVVDGGTERESVNHTIQATNADATKWALVLLDEELRRRGWHEYAYPVLTVHDEIVVECVERLQHQVALLLKECMIEGSRIAGMKRVPTVVEVAIGTTWKK